MRPSRGGPGASGIRGGGSLQFSKGAQKRLGGKVVGVSGARIMALCFVELSLNRRQVPQFDEPRRRRLKKSREQYRMLCYTMGAQRR